MENPHQPHESTVKWIFKTPIIVPISVIMVITFYIGSTFFFFASEDMGKSSYLKRISFEIFLLCEIGIISAIFHNKRLLDEFLSAHPVIEGKVAIEKLKPVIRTIMYSMIFHLVILAIASLTAITSIFHHGLAHSLVVIILSVATGRLIRWYKTSEEAIRKIECSQKSLKPELDHMLDCWLRKPLPNF